MQDKSWLRLLDDGELPAVGFAQPEERSESLGRGSLSRRARKAEEIPANRRELIFRDPVTVLGGQLSLFNISLPLQILV